MTLKDELKVKEAACQCRIYECEANIKCCCEYGNRARAARWLNSKLKATRMMKTYSKLIKKLEQELGQ